VSSPADPVRPGAAGFVPAAASLGGLRTAASGCTGCELAGPATQTVFSAGGAGARLAFVGEQPGDVEDQRGLPFVGPAGQLLDRALGEVGIDRSTVYVTNSVKHFRFSGGTGGTRRIHQTPDTLHVDACKPWLLAELALVDPDVVVLLGATAGKALLGPTFRVTRDRGRLMPRAGRRDEPAALQGGWMLATLHPSAILRADDRDVAYAGFVADLRIAAAVLSAGRPPAPSVRVDHGVVAVFDQGNAATTP
jgi:uracil-DNA glycosylase